MIGETMIISLLQPSDYDDWLPLWLDNMEHLVDADVTAETWRRICDPNHAVKGLAYRADSAAPITGICHYVLHPTTGSIKPVCYMQDVFVDPAARRQGIARTLITTLAQMGKTQGWARIYWLAERKNDAAQRLYQSIGIKLDFTLHLFPL